MAQSNGLLEEQLSVLKAKLLAERKASNKEIEQSLTITQKETMLKHAKKDLVAAKTKISSLKTKNKDLKQQLDQIPQKQPNNNQGRANSRAAASHNAAANKD